MLINNLNTRIIILQYTYISFKPLRKFEIDFNTLTHSQIVSFHLKYLCDSIQVNRNGLMKLWKTSILS